MGMGGARPGAGRKPKIDARRPATFTLPPDQLAAIEAIASRDGISKSEALSRLITRALADDAVPASEVATPQPAPYPVAVGDVLQDLSGQRARRLRVTEIGDRGVWPWPLIATGPGRWNGIGRRTS